MGMPLKRRSVRAMLRRWRDDEARLVDMFNGPVEVDDFADSGEIMRNLGSAIAAAQAFVNSGKE